MNLKKLKEPFDEKDLEWRVQQSGEKNGKFWAMVLTYISNRAVQDRLDDVCGPENWKNEFAPAPDGGVMCGLSIRVGDEWITKWDGAENTQIESVKGGLSGAMKRAGVPWGIGRYLYKLDANFAEVSPNGKYSSKTKDGKWFKWNPPRLPAWALPKVDETAKYKAEKDAIHVAGSIDDLKDVWASMSKDAQTYLFKYKENKKKKLLEAAKGVV